MSLKSLKNVAVLSGGLPTRNFNTPSESAEWQEQYLDPVSIEFTKKYAKYASDYVQAEAQGLLPGDPWGWTTVFMRMAGVVSVAASMTRKVDAYKQIMVASRNIEYIRPGTKFITMGSTWLAINPENVPGSAAVGLVEKCNAVWHYLDYYGNVCSEPMAISSALARANASNPQDTMRITQNYFNVKCQHNEATKQLDENSRLIFGRKAYRLTGFSDFEQEFTEDEFTVRMLEFTIRVDEFNDATDDKVNKVAGGLTFRWEVDVSGNSILAAGATSKLTASSRRCGDAVTDTEEHPVSYSWSSSDETVATVDENGLVTAVGTGDVTITATLEQNQSVSGDLALTVADGGQILLWTMEPPEILRAYHTATMSVGRLDNEIAPSDTLYPGNDVLPSDLITASDTEWTVTGGEEGSYTYEVDGGTLTLTCWKGSAGPVTVTAVCGAEALTATIELAGV